MDIPSFLSLLNDEALTFVRADLFEDKYEGKLPIKTAEQIDADTRKQITAGKLDKQYWNYSEILNNHTKDVYLNCWCNENHEMVHMWKIYSKESGIAIETDYESLKKALRTKETVYPTEIKYTDFKNDHVDWNANALTVFTLKRKEYKSEREFRLILPYPKLIQDQLKGITDNDERVRKSKLLYLNTPVIKCEVDPIKLIKNIHVSPYAPKWYLNLIKDISKKYNLKTDFITQSDL